MGKDRPTILMIGIRGFPNIPGGAETHVQEISTRLAARGWKVIAFSRLPFADPAVRQFEGVEIRPIATTTRVGLEAFWHTLKAVLESRKVKPAIVHIHNIGPGLLTPLARLLGHRVVVTGHSLNYKHSKWSRFGKLALRLGEKLSAKYSDALIAVSPTVASEISHNQSIVVPVIPNGISQFPNCELDPAIQTLIGQKPYLVCVGRINRDKGIPELLEAWRDHLTDLHEQYQLIIVGAPADNEPDAEQIVADGQQTPAVTFTGPLPRNQVGALLKGATMFVHPSHFEGHPIAIIEAISQRLPCVVSDIPELRILDFPTMRYFAVRNVAALAQALRETLLDLPGPEALSRAADTALATYDWDDITSRTEAIYCEVLERASGNRTR
ncbi:MAG: glycosyltransferase family 4 protein [Armatimonadetes bacterium]|nr:glycosyltransferase family 4 protein [Armatimonadota bacterium]